MCVVGLLKNIDQGRKMSSRNVYGVSIDSRSRNVDEPDNAYTINLDRQLDRVKTIQLGSFQFQDARYAFDDTAAINYSEPILIPADTYLSFRETVSTVTKATGARLDSTRVVSLLLPPSTNLITGMAGDVVTTASATGLNFGVSYYPSVNLRMSVVGADFPQDLQAFVTPTFPTDAGPLLTAATTVSPYVTTTPRSFTYATNYLDELMGGVGSKVLRHYSAGAYSSYISAPRPTLVELLVMLNEASSDLSRRTDITDTVAAASNATPIVITTGATGIVTGDQVVIAGVTGNTAANGTFIITVLSPTTFELDGSAGNGAYVAGGTVFSPQQLNVSVTFGFNNVTNKLACFAPTRVCENSLSIVTRKLTLIGSLSALLGFNNINLDPAAEVDVPPTIKRRVPIKAGTFTANEIATSLQYRLNPGVIDSDLGVGRTFYYTLPSGVTSSQRVLVGRYSGQQLADRVTFTTGGIPSQISLTYDAATGKFTFTHALGLPFGLQFEDTPELVLQRFGFDAINLSGKSSYTSVRPGVFGVDETATTPDNTYSISLDETNKHFTFRTNPPTLLNSESGTNTAGVDANWTPEVGIGNYAHGFKAGDILTAIRPTLSGTLFSATKNITGASNTSPIVITTTAANGLTTGDNVTIRFVEGNEAANGTFDVTVTGATTFELDGSTGSGAYTQRGNWWTNTSFVGAAQPASAVYTVVVQSAWDAAGDHELILEPTASIFSAQDVAVNQISLGVPSNTDGFILIRAARRNVFMLHMEHSEGSPDTFGFPPVAWPPSEKAILSASTVGRTVLRTLPTYDAATLSIPVSSSYTSPFSWNLLPPDYMVIVLNVTCAAADIHTHSFRGTSFPIFAKLLINFPYTSVSEEMLFTTFSGHARLRHLGIEFQNPDGTLVQFNGRPHTFTLLFTLEEDAAVLPCF
jgi:hypothetical protein